jgi:hypothetical protein
MLEEPIGTALRMHELRLSIGFQILDADPPAQGVKNCTPNNNLASDSPRQAGGRALYGKADVNTQQGQTLRHGDNKDGTF